ncbi:type II toxin-antitoxin system RelB/DinJ family antitoxin [Lactobacillus sp. ESL0731]|uniref:type II toxin-antitoxin system RelB/DinJ family antitoxin n=1 Tax=unclassified Lactobacillus TaxID=2620435 RepID=UPI0023F67E40|nr:MULTISPECIES: type II toxin-antitoxin system RelB/DinJ family antitoxin [unclassified Lactobacillus]WEV51244.1 type II toxin-antitoxin system RelB/DinJ family antitoxin [Lactobacillus sp. ESL0700]WEV62374.1 type II toxin-antitoxin system RelB/DinJ family antitoxin [Lactobacillus sp. ESL0731]
MAQTARIEARMDPNIKAKASKELEKHGLSISDFVRMSLTEVATEGLPKQYVIPKLSATVQASLAEIKADMDGTKNLPKAHSYEELMELLND